MSEPRKHLGEHAPRNNHLTDRIIHTGVVISLEDPDETERIKVRVKGLDDKIKDADLPFCAPLLPKIFGLTPKVGEEVNVFLADTTNVHKNRFFLGPVISQLQNIQNDPHFFSAPSGSDARYQQPKRRRKNDPENAGIYPDKEDVALNGRDNSDVIIRDKEVQIRAGQSDVKDKNKRNKKNPAVVQVKISRDGSQSSVVGIADTFCFVSHKGNKKVSVELDEAGLADMMKNLYSAVLGEVLLEVLEIVKDFCINHVHAYPGMAANPGAGSHDKLMAFDLNSILSKRFKIN